MNEILNRVYFGNSIQDYIIFVGVFVGLFIFFRLFRTVLISKLESFFEKTENDFDDFLIGVVSRISKFFYWFFAFYIATKFLNLPDLFKTILNHFIVLILVWEVVETTNYFIEYITEKFTKKRDSSSLAAYRAMGKMARWIIYIIAFLFVLSNFGIDVTTLATGLGIGGIAIAFAFQAILKDLFSYFTILLDKTVRVGDFIYVGDKKGRVKNIGVKAVRLEAIDGEEIIIANDMVTGGGLSNFGKTKERRVSFDVGAAYGTPVKKLKKIKDGIQKIIESHGKEVEFRRCFMKTMNESSLDFNVVYYIKTRDYNIYSRVNEEVNFAILELFEKQKVEIPFPSRTVYSRKG